MDYFDSVAVDVEDALRKARVFISRKDEASAMAIMDKLLEKYPEHPKVLDAKGDILRELGKLEEAKECYERVISKYKGWVSTEKKHAEVVFQLEQAKSAAEMFLKDMSFAELMNPAGARRSGGIAAFLSLLAPGFGQIYNGELVKGIVMLAIAIFSWIMLFSFGYVASSVNSVGWFFIIVLVVLYIVSMIDAGASAAKSVASPPPPRPKPPVDLPFE
ncbi:MAG TPA: tetratricopeptide repeat protein [Fimbriimonadales bacterium]|nr:tetratricopeptide repeat protein [Fimbriimonadales bacterium]